ncbi:MAG: NAD(P)/FAD-dependent oxidoreductase [Rhodocyclaceae bacterium]|nr:NAD(P)/FAD-dependent oxidoreductase [Rhodocyclaceae bacterium]MCB1964044.1 NAD(P)/FAD-dependent oxidoreductase [Rhodocyclaceae bacterium]
MSARRSYDVLVIGGGGAGMMCAAAAGRRGRRVLVIDHAATLAEKIRISGGGRCNFTNLDVSAANFLSNNPHFCRSALARYGAHDFVALVERHGIRYHEKTLGQLFCDDSSQQIIDLLLTECADAGVDWAQPATVHRVDHDAAAGYAVDSSRGRFDAPSLVIATGGLSIPKIGATDFGHRLARQFGLPVIAPRPALVPLTLSAEALEALTPLAGAAFEVIASCGAGRFRERALVTHRGLSGPAILQISSYWQAACAAGRPEPVRLDLLPGQDARGWLGAHADSGALLATLLSEHLPRRVAQAWAQLHDAARPVNRLSAAERDALGDALGAWSLAPSGTQGYAKAEVTLGGVDTRALSSKTMEASAQPGLYFIGEVVDVTGHLGGYNFQWAWSSGHAAGQFA